MQQKMPFDNTFDKNIKPQKFFFRDLNNDLNRVKKVLEEEYGRIQRLEMFGITQHDDEKDIFTYSKSLSTHKSREYNAFQMYYPFMHELYSAVVDMTREACKYYEIDYNSEQWMCQAWFNINSNEKGGKLEWHDHIQPELHIPAFHGYYAVNAEPSETYYDINGNQFINKNKNNRAILSLMGFPHAMGPWEWEGDRITIAYDVMPLKILRQEDFIQATKNGVLKEDEKFWEQHYFPLPKIY
jgi:hypothetical protein